MDESWRLFGLADARRSELVELRGDPISAASITTQADIDSAKMTQRRRQSQLNDFRDRSVAKLKDLLNTAVERREESKGGFIADVFYAVLQFDEIQDLAAEYFRESRDKDAQDLEKLMDGIGNLEEEVNKILKYDLRKEHEWYLVVMVEIWLQEFLVNPEVELGRLAYKLYCFQSTDRREFHELCESMGMDSGMSPEDLEPFTMRKMAQVAGVPDDSSEDEIYLGALRTLGEQLANGALGLIFINILSLALQIWAITSVWSWITGGFTDPASSDFVIPGSTVPGAAGIDPETTSSFVGQVFNGLQKKFQF